MKVILVLSIIGLISAEPPVSYLPPSNQYGAPSGSFGSPSFASHTAAILRPNAQYGAPNQQYGAPDGGHNGGGYGGHRGYDDGPSEPANYNFEYHVYEPSYGNDFGHQEARQGDVAQGRYFVLLPDGRKQIVDYIADSNGYKPKISYEGTANGGGYAGAGGYQGGGGGSAGYHY
ncbi:hypothetical protein PPYR_11749 [Photinus pyralis]|uniref:Pro-resilin n=1 Tax=Photinus pyralis TaxID=7054 RepID=A0A5N4A502_PHOPY|nr:pro-resilin-like [Photinus pyralis]XP_031357297.1 pro-resilin-like [Photinus pyralis]KAB0792403.1 hypothetical protein PPYR_14362 [Photinus pyralis]KAB0794910.1 hypothetical protein PPYR_11749 [Photinus pyralis]